MKRRAVRRQYAILGVLARLGPLTQTSIALELHRGLGTLYPDLAVLEHNGWIVSEWNADYGARVRLYRLP